MSREVSGEAGPDYDMAEGRHAGAHFGPKCPGCRLWTEASEGYVCWTPKCPCMGLAANSQESAERAAGLERAGITARTMTGDAARDVQEMRDWLAYQEAKAALIDVEIEHSDL